MDTLDDLVKKLEENTTPGAVYVAKNFTVQDVIDHINKIAKMERYETILRLRHIEESQYDVQRTVENLEKDLLDLIKALTDCEEGDGDEHGTRKVDS